MAHHCHDQSCSQHQCCPCKPGDTCGCNCHQESHSNHHRHFSDQLLEMADEAWMELLKDKIKQKIQDTSGDHLDKLASLVSTANHNRWNNKMGLMNDKEEYEAQLSDYFKR